MKWEQLVRLGRALPEVEEGTWYGTPSLAVRGKSFVRLKEDGASVVFLVEDVDEQQLLIETKPAVWFITDHYRGYAAVLARLAKLTAAQARPRLERAWRKRAPKALSRPLDAASKE